MMPYRSRWHENRIKISGFPPQIGTGSREIDERRQMALYQQVHFRFITAVFQVRPAYVDGYSGIIQSCGRLHTIIIKWGKFKCIKMRRFQMEIYDLTARLH